MVPTHTQTYSTQLPFVTFLCLLSECVRSSGPVRADNSGVHRQLIATGGLGERQGALALLGQLQRGRGRQQPRQRGRRRRRRSLREESADTLKSQKLTVSSLVSSRVPRASHARWSPPSWRSWRIMGKISSCPIRTWRQPECPATTRACWSPPSRWLANSYSR